MNKRHYKSLVAAAIITSLSHTAIAETLAPIGAVQDTWTNGSGAGSGSNYGTQTTFRIDTGKMRAFMQFTVAGIPDGHTVESAILTLTAQGNKSGNIPDTFIAAVENAPNWDQTTLTDLTDDALIAAAGDAIATATDIAVGATADFDIAAGIDGNGTFTFLINIADSDARATKYYSIEASEEFRPTLTITTKPGEVDPGPVGDTTAPVFADIEPIQLNATGVKTDINALLEIKATDETDGEVTATVDGDSSFLSGKHQVTLQATDKAGNKATKENVIVNIKPYVVLTVPETVSLPAGASTKIGVALSGPAASYPATIDYAITGDATTEASGTLTFEDAASAIKAQDVEITLLGSAKTDQTAVLSLTATTKVQASSEKVTISAFEGNAKPIVSLTLTQSDVTIATISANTADTIPYIDATKGDVTVAVVVQDFNPEDTHSIAWTNTSTALTAETTQKSFVFSPAELSGNFTLSVNAKETNTPESYPSNILAAQIKIIATALPELVADVDTDGDGINDLDEGIKDSDGDGIVDYLDDNADTTQLPLADEQKSLQTLPGLTLSLGSISAAQGIEAKSAIISLEDLAATVAADSADTADTGFQPIEGASLFNFTISGLATAGDAAPVVYPLPKDVIIGEETEYRKYTPTAGWATFVSDADNTIASAAKDGAGNCPAPNDELYIDGLKTGDSCIQLTIKDGGIYDADGLENGSIEDPGVLAESFELIQWAKETLTLGSNKVNENSSVVLTKYLSALLGNADISRLTFSIGGDASWLTIDEEAVLSADLSKLATGDYSASVDFTSENDQTGTLTVNTSVAYNNAPKLAAVELVAASRNEAYAASIAESISDAESDTYTIEKVAGPYWLNVSETGELSGTPLKANIGDNIITLKLTDDKGATNDVTFNVPVVDSEVRASDGGSFSAGLLTLLGLLSLRRRKATK